ncbi:hypothetical protein ES703_56585 [subsurface metagenome]
MEAFKDREEVFLAFVIDADAIGVRGILLHEAVHGLFYFCSIGIVALGVDLVWLVDNAADNLFCFIDLNYLEHGVLLCLLLLELRYHPDPLAYLSGQTIPPFLPTRLTMIYLPGNHNSRPSLSPYIA